MIVEHHLGLLVNDAGAVRDLVDFVGGARMGVRERDVQHRAGTGGRAALHQDLLEVRHQIMRHRDVDRGQELDALDRCRACGFDLDRFVEMRLEGLAHEPVEPHDPGPGIRVERRIEPRRDAAPALGRDPHDGIGRDSKLLHQGAVEPNAQARAGADRAGQMIYAGMHMRTPAVGVGIGMRIGDVVHGATVVARLQARSFEHAPSPYTRCRGHCRVGGRNRCRRPIDGP